MSTNKSNAAKKTFAEEGLEEVNETLAQAEAAITDNIEDDKNFDFDSLEQAGGMEPVAFYYRFSPPKPNSKSKSAFEILAPGDVIKGRYVKGFTNGKKNANGEDQITHLVRLIDGRLAGLPSSGGLSKDLSGVLPGRIKIEYKGMSPAKGGKWKGTDCHNFLVFPENRKPRN